MNSTPNIQKQVKSYIVILVGLIVLTLVSVGISQMDMRVGTRVFVALVIAGVQAFISLAYLMHLNWERRFIYVILAFTVFFFLGLIFLPTLTHLDQVEYHHVP